MTTSPNHGTMPSGFMQTSVRAKRMFIGGIITVLVILATTSASYATSLGSMTINIGGGQTAWVRLTIPTTPAPNGWGALTVGTEVVVSGTNGIVGADTRPGLKPSSCAQQWLAGPGWTMLGDGTAAGAYYVSIANISFSPRSYVIAAQMESVQISPVDPNKPLGSYSSINLVTHGRSSWPMDMRVIGQLLSAKNPTRSTHWVDWSGARAGLALEGSRFIRPTARAVAKILASKNISLGRTTDVGHSWGGIQCSFLSEIGSLERILALDPAKTDGMANWFGNRVPFVNFGTARKSMSLVSLYGMYGSVTNANTASICIGLDVMDDSGSRGSWDAQHWMPVRVAETILSSRDAISTVLTGPILGTSTLLNRNGGTDYVLKGRAVSTGAYLSSTTLTPQ